MTLLGTRRRLVLAVVLGLALVVVAVGGAIATSFVRSGKVKAMKVATEDTLVGTSSADWTDVPGMSFATSVPNGEQGTFLATFSAESKCFATAAVIGACRIRVLINNNFLVPGEVTFDNTGKEGEFETNSMQFLAGPIPAGTYNWKVQYSAGSGYQFALTNRTFSVLRSKV